MNRGIVFFIGLLFGILICGLLYYFDIKIFESKFMPIYEKEVVTRKIIDTVYLEPPARTKKQNVDIIAADTGLDNNTEIQPGDTEVSIYETTFSMEGAEQDDIFSDQLLKTRIVKVKPLKQETALPENSFQSFEIQQWSTPVKNKITFQRNQNMLKIKGIEINTANVVFWNSAYYLEINNRYYVIPETERFEKLNPIIIPQ